MQNPILRHIFLFSSFILLISAENLRAQNEEPATREIISLDFQKQRPKTGGVKGEAKFPVKSTAQQKNNLAAITGPRRKYNLVKSWPVKKNPVKSDPAAAALKTVVRTEQLGVTFWRLRPVTPADGDAPLFSVKVGDGRENWTAERVKSGNRFKTGDRVRFTIESSRTGYLYIINRELYADGTAGVANVIFPTLRTRGGNNFVQAGSLIEIPGAADAVPYFTVRPKRADYAGEELAVLIVGEKLPFEVGIQPLPVDLSQFDKWFEDWASTVDVYDAENGEGVAQTAAEAAAASSASRALEQEDPLPQTIYKVRVSAGTPLLIPFRMATAP